MSAATPHLSVTCILASYNRPVFVRQALESVARQTYRNYELIVVDESDIFRIGEAVGAFDFPCVTLIRHLVADHERPKVNRLSININEGLRRARGDLVCYLADDDFLLPGWFEGAARYFAEHSAVQNAYGRLYYTTDRSATYDPQGRCRFPPGPFKDPYCVLDHNQVMHRRITPLTFWPEEIHTVSAPDGIFFRAIAARGPFVPIQVDAAVKRMHAKNLQQCVGQYRKGTISKNRE